MLIFPMSVKTSNVWSFTYYTQEEDRIRDKFNDIKSNIAVDKCDGEYVASAGAITSALPVTN